MNTFIYGVFKNTDDFAKSLSSLKALGLSDVAIVKNTVEDGYCSAELQPSKKTPFIIGGAVGAIIGGFAGAVIASRLPDVGAFQLVTIMAMISCSVISAYFGLWLAGFLYWIDRPLLEHEVFEGKIHNGAVILGVTVDNSEQKLKVLESLDANGAVEIVARCTTLCVANEALALAEEGGAYEDKLQAVA